MVLWFSGIAIVLACLMAYGIVWMGRIKRHIVRSVQFLFAAAIMTMLCDVAAVTSATEWVATLTHGLYFALTDWLVLTVFWFARNYTGYFKKNKIVLWIFIVISSVDTLSMILNTFFHHVFSSVWYVSEKVSCYVVETHFPFYHLHLLSVYPMALFVIGMFFVKARRTMKLYRRKYDVVLYSFLCVLAANIAYRFVDIPIDFSVAIYILLALSIGYFGLLYVPKGLTARLLSFAIKDLDTGILCYDLDGNLIYANNMARALFDMTNHDESITIDTYYRMWLDNRDQNHLKDMKWHQESEIGGEMFYYETTFKRLLDPNGNFVGSYFGIKDVTEETTRYKKEHHRATHDELTGIYNRTGFFEKTRIMLDECPDIPFCMLCSDVKDFKMYNDMFGVEAGDELLKAIAGLIMHEAADNVTYGRLSNDRFAICMPMERYSEERMMKYLVQASKFAYNDLYRLHIQMGVYEITDPSIGVSIMCDRARIAISSIKSDYQKFIAKYDEEMGQMLQNEKKILGNFDEALENGQFHMYLQPQIASDGTLLGAEALVRWIHPERGLIPPYEFVPLFEKTGYIHRLDLHIWELACKKLKQWKEIGREDLHISVNISAKDFYYLDLYETFTGLVEKYDINPKNLKLEITETTIMTDMLNQLNLLDRLREYGFHIEIDDFGSGYSSLNTLKDINVDVVKMDMGFLRKTENADRSRIILNSAIAMIKSLGIAVITEGVETEEQVVFLKTAGCDMFQGYYFDKPMPTESFEEKYKLFAA